VDGSKKKGMAVGEEKKELLQTHESIVISSLF
jgi:hypothetical protein